MGVIDWLLEGDPAIRWQVLRDLTDASPDEVAAELLLKVPRSPRTTPRLPAPTSNRHAETITLSLTRPTAT
jgi:hypothetical protein